MELPLLFTDSILLRDSNENIGSGTLITVQVQGVWAVKYSSPLLPLRSPFPPEKYLPINYFITTIRVQDIYAVFFQL